MTGDANSSQSRNRGDPPSPSAATPGLVRRLARARIGRIPLAGIVGVFAVGALLWTAYGLGTPSAILTSTDNGKSFGGIQAPMPAATAAPVAVDGERLSAANGGGPSQVALDQTQTVPTETTQIVKTGSMQIEVADLNKAVAQAQSTIVGMGGYVSDSSRSGDNDSAVATVTYRLPVAKWDDALAAMRGLAQRLVSEQTNSTDVTSQVIDLDARLDNLKATEAALQGIMARATEIKDVLAVEEQLSNVEGQIEQLTAQRNHLKDQAAMSTLAVTFMTPTTVTVQAARGWDFGAQVDEAVAALVRIGQGLATIVVWAVIVGVPVVLGLLVLAIVVWIFRRVFRRRPKAPAAGAEA